MATSTVPLAQRQLLSKIAASPLAADSAKYALLYDDQPYAADSASAALGHGDYDCVAGPASAALLHDEPECCNYAAGVDFFGLDD